MKKLFLLLLISITLLFSQIPKTYAYTVVTTGYVNGDLAIIIGYDSVSDTCTLYDWNNDVIYINVPSELVAFTGNMWRTVEWNSGGPIWDLALADEPIIPFLNTVIIPYYTTLAETESYAEGYGEGYTDGYDFGYNTGKAEGTTGGFDEGFTTGYSEGYGAGYLNGIIVGHDSGYTEGWSEGYSIGSLNADDAIYNAGYSAGLAYEANDFYDNIETWLVPAIIVVLFLGGFIAFARKKRDSVE
jgi:hypothetical protein